MYVILFFYRGAARDVNEKSVREDDQSKRQKTCRLLYTLNVISMQCENKLL